jgi:hypothetical protein
MARYFTLKEMCESNKATQLKIDNFPTFEVAHNLKILAETVLDRIREDWGSAIRVTSGYRCDALNRAVGGSKTSVHPLGWAADLQPYNGMTETFIRFVRKWLDDNQVAYDQLIRETDAKTGSIWLHIGLYGPKGQQRRQYLDIVKK